MRTRRSCAPPGVERQFVSYRLNLAISTYAEARLLAARRGVSVRKFLHDAVARAILEPNKE